ncbi:MAG: carbamoyltransferase family protein [Gammaproteobacteria bacterium]|nr:carbamoyltransferase C-terminal domain-containing protein [Gammaproteobacteria bacterium]
MQILGIGDHISCGSALVRDGVLVAAVTDERLIREKMVFGIPRESIRNLMRGHSLAPGDIDAVAVATRNQHLIDGYVDFKDGWFGLKRSKYKQYLFEVASNVSKLRRRIPTIDKVYYAMRQPAFNRRRKELQRILREEFGFTCPIHFLDHHYCHITSAYYTSGYRDAAVFSIDGGGDGNCGKVYDVADGKFTELCAIPSFDSLGTFYSYITQICGFKAGRHEGKITGLAANGKPQYVPILRKILALEDGRFRNVANVFFLSALRELQRRLPADFSHKDLAASIQDYSEELVVGLVRHWLKQTGRRNVALAGGVCANVKINQRIHEMPEVDSVFIHPGMSDEGMPVGAALGLYYQRSGKRYEPTFPTMPHVYLGPEYSDAEIRQELEKCGVEATRYEDVESEIARLLAANAVVARFNGRMEYGPRALGNRTILYPATDPSVHYWMNEALHRTEFMPFAPVVMAEYAEQCFTGLDGAENAARFMTITFNCTEWMAKNCPGVVHIDNTARPQLVSEQDNPSLHRILSKYRELTGLPCLINTSFNMHEEPIVCSPYDAIRAFQLGHLDYLAIGQWVARSPSPQPRNADTTRYDEAMNRRGSVHRY